MSAAPRVFISYSHDSPAHDAAVLALSERLRADGIDAWIDVYEPAPAGGWPRWMRDRLEWADLVLMVCSETYQRRFYGREAPGVGKGVTFEGLILTNELYDAHGRAERILPVALDATGARFVPDVLTAHTLFRLPDAYEALHARLNGRALIEPGPLGPPRPPLPRKAAVWATDPARAVPHRLPARNPRFVGRAKELSELHRRLGEAAAVGVTQAVATWGHGGVGKTTLAVEYAWTHLLDYPGGVFHLRGEAVVPEAEIALLADVLGVPPGASSTETAAAVRRHLEAGPPALLLLDDAGGRYPEWRKVLPAGPVRRLLTTRKPRVTGVAMYPVERLAPGDGAALLGRYREDAAANPEAVAQVVAWCDGLAVLLALVGVYLLRHPTVPWPAYAASLAQKGLSTLRRTEADAELDDYERRVDDVLDAARTGLSAAEERALAYACLLPQDVVPRSWVAALLEAEPDVPIDPAPGREADPGGGVVDGLVELSLLRAEEGEVFALHRVLRLRLRELLPPDLRSLLLDRVGVLAEARGEASHAALADPAARWEVGPLLALSYALEAEGQRIAAASLANWVHTPLENLARWSEDVASLSRFVDGQGHTLGEGDDREGAIVLSNLGASLRALGHLRAARSRMEQALRIDEAALPAGHPTLAIRYSILALILRDLGDLPAARERVEQALRIDEAALPPGHPTLASCYSNLALILQDLGDLPAARDRMEQAIRINEAALPAGHPALANGYSNLATILQDLGDLPAARERMEQALRIDEGTLPPGHPTLAVLYSNLALILKELGDLPAARERMEQALRINETALPAGHPTLAIRYSNLAMILQSLADLAGARDRMEQAIRIHEAALPPRHPSLAVDYSNLATILKDLGDLAGARDRMEQATRIHEATLPPGHPMLANCYSNFAMILRDLGDLPAARDRMEQAIRIDEAALPPGHPSLAVRYSNLAHILLAQGDLPAARTLWLRALAIARGSLGPGHPHTLKILGFLEKNGGLPEP